MSLSERHPDSPYELTGKKLGDDQFAIADVWDVTRAAALVGVGIEPGAADVFARYAADELFTQIDEGGGAVTFEHPGRGLHVCARRSRSGRRSRNVEPAVIGRRIAGRYLDAAVQRAETFVFPEGIGAVGMRERRARRGAARAALDRLPPRHLQYGLGDEVIEILQTLHKLGLDRTALGPCLEAGTGSCSRLDDIDAEVARLRGVVFGLRSEVVTVPGQGS